MSNVALQLGKNFSQLGQEGFENTTESIKSLDDALIEASRNF